MAAIASTLDVLPVSVSTTVDGVTTVAILAYPHVKTTCGVGKTGLQLYLEDALRNSKLVPLELETGKVLKEIVCAANPVVTDLGVWDYGNGGISILANAIRGLGLRLRVTEQATATPQRETKLMFNEEGGYSFPPLFSGSWGYSSLITGYHTASYLFEILANNDTVLKSLTKQITVSAVAPVTPPAPPTPPTGTLASVFAARPAYATKKTFLDTAILQLRIVEDGEYFTIFNDSTYQPQSGYKLIDVIDAGFETNLITATNGRRFKKGHSLMYKRYELPVGETELFNIRAGSAQSIIF